MASSTPSTLADWSQFPERLQPRWPIEGSFARLCIANWDERNAEFMFPFRLCDETPGLDAVKLLEVPQPVEEIYFRWAHARLRSLAGPVEGERDWASLSARTVAGLAVDAYEAELEELVLPNDH